MRAIPTTIADVLVLEPTVVEDARGYFFESFNLREFSAALAQTPAGAFGNVLQFVQDNHSRSTGNVVRGLHYQINRPQGKLVRVIEGTVFDVAVDLRASSATFGHWVGTTLSSTNRRQKWIPPGFAHGFAVCSDEAQVLYKTTDYFAPDHQRCIAWNDPALNIDWPLQGEPVLSARDRCGTLLAEADVYL
ncbi:MAG: dTDP-4-dehydrorhamnose 3,5-epimerase [Pseudomonadota bacterium]